MLAESVKKSFVRFFYMGVLCAHPRMTLRSPNPQERMSRAAKDPQVPYNYPNFRRAVGDLHGNWGSAHALLSIGTEGGER